MKLGGVEVHLAKHLSHMRQVNYTQLCTYQVIRLHYNFYSFFEAPSAAPTSIEAYQLNLTSAFLSWRPPLAQYHNGIIRGYHIHVELNSTDEAAELSGANSTETKFVYTTQDQHLLMDDLRPFAVYTFRVAAYTVERGPFSEPLMIVLSGGRSVKTNTAVCIDINCIYIVHL